MYLKELWFVKLKLKVTVPLVFLAALSACGELTSEQTSIAQDQRVEAGSQSQASSTSDSGTRIDWPEKYFSDGSLASSYRVLYGAAGQRPKEVLVATNYAVIDEDLPSDVNILVEAYDAEGSSVFFTL